MIIPSPNQEEKLSSQNVDHPQQPEINHQNIQYFLPKDAQGNEQIPDLENDEDRLKMEDIESIGNVNTSETRRCTMENNYQEGNNNTDDTNDAN